MPGMATLPRWCRGDALGDHGASADNGALPDYHPLQQGDSGTKVDVVLDAHGQIRSAHLHIQHVLALSGDVAVSSHNEQSWSRSTVVPDEEAFAGRNARTGSNVDM